MGKDKINILITAIGGGGVGEQILKALILAERKNYRLIGADASPYCPQFALVENAFTMPRASDPQYLEVLLNLCKKLGIQAVFAGSEPEILLMAEHAEEIREAGIFLPINPPGVLKTCMDKIKCSEFLEQAGLPHPKYKILKDENDLEEIDWYPLIVKPYKNSGGSKDVYIVQNKSQALHLLKYLNAGGQENLLMCQEYIGSADSEYTAGILHDMDGNFINSIVMKRMLDNTLSRRLHIPNISGRKDLGSHLTVSSGISQGSFAGYPEVAKAVEQIAAKLGAISAINVQCRVHGGKVMAFEINPRFSGTTSLRAMVGYNEPDILLRKHLLGEKIETRFPYEHKTVLRSLKETFIRDKPVWSYEELDN